LRSFHRNEPGRPVYALTEQGLLPPRLLLVATALVALAAHLAQSAPAQTQGTTVSRSGWSGSRRSLRLRVRFRLEPRK